MKENPRYTFLLPAFKARFFEEALLSIKNQTYKDFKVIPFSELTVEYLDNYRSIYPRYRDIITSLDSSISVNPID